MATLPTADITSFNTDQFNAFQKAASLGSGVQVTDNGNKYTVDQNTGPRAITPASLAPTTPANIPAPPTPASTNGMVAGNNAGLAGALAPHGYTLDANGQFVYKAPETSASANSSNGYEDLFKKYLDNQTAPPSLADAYTKDYGDSGIQEKKQLVQDLTNQLNTLTARGTAGKLQAEDRFAPMQAIVGEQASIDRGIAIKALPIQAQLAEASGNLKLAQDHLDTIFKLHSEDAQNQYEFKNKLIDSVFAFASKQEQAKLDEKKTQQAQDFQSQQNQLNNAQALANTAITNGQGALAGKIMALDPKSATYAADVAKLAGQIQPKAEKNNLQFVSATANQPAGTFNPATGVFTPTSRTGGGKDSTLQLSNTKSNVDLISGLSTDKYLNTAVGPNSFARLSFSNAFTGGKTNFIAGIEEMRSQLNLDKLIQSKSQGATFGALSDNELRMLASAATKIGTWAVKDKEGNITGYNTSEGEFKKELDKINNFSKLDYIIKGGDPTDVGAQIMPDGTVWAKNSDGTLTQIK